MNIIIKLRIFLLSRKCLVINNNKNAMQKVAPSNISRVDFFDFQKTETTNKFDAFSSSKMEGLSISLQVLILFLVLKLP